MVARFAGVTCTVTTGSFSFSSLLQPTNRKIDEAVANEAAVHPVDLRIPMWSLSFVRLFVCLMELLALPSRFADLPAQRDSARLHPGRRRWIAHRSSARSEERRVGKEGRARAWRGA